MSEVPARKSSKTGGPKKSKSTRSGGTVKKKTKEKSVSSSKIGDEAKKKSVKKTKTPKVDDDTAADRYAMAADAMTMTTTAPQVSPSTPLHELPDPDEMMNALNKDIKSLKLEARRLFDEMEAAKQGSEESKEELMKIKREAQLEKLKGNELVKIDHLLRMGFDEEVMKEHLEELNKGLRNEYKEKQKDKKNIESNITKMVSANKESEKAVSAAFGATGPLIAKQQVLQAKLEQAEVELYAIETKVNHRRNMKSVEIASKDKFKSTLKDVVRKIQIRCRDQELLADVLVKAGKSLETDLGLDSKLSDSDSEDNESDDVDNVSISSNNSSSSVSVSSVES
mmetsp:Transcript_6942/g.10992  ORF Transcript_6942/g.10992 Transcript_6942/m.10992 type:complete len:339 (+) Transcript_6942:146-1162(+)|eukprot:CAMPEP_0178833018 /NCGR_PEP_ID=MMETSP0746-20121128/10306_1 /TAXON_ID=913974 /ORGANISM="Nitzschia punctata, Strain CCMP561" /LENGTH=338 /DNA_ID=CAMNT_0020495371 /DNA_START=73 /DNA_END=1089 /DNA_ORIENTATION=+